MDVNQSGRDALVVRGYLSEEERDDGAAIKRAIEGVISDMAFELQIDASRPHASGGRENRPRARRDRRRQDSGEFVEFGPSFGHLPDHGIEIVGIEKKVILGRVTRLAQPRSDDERQNPKGDSVR